MREKDEEDLVINDWKFAAMVIDRYVRPQATSTLKLTIAPQVLPDRPDFLHHHDHRYAPHLCTTYLRTIMN
jgi:hypothetical protein